MAFDTTWPFAWIRIGGTSPNGGTTANTTSAPSTTSCDQLPKVNGRPLTRFTKPTSDKNRGSTRKLRPQNDRKTALSLERPDRDRLNSTIILLSSPFPAFAAASHCESGNVRRHVLRRTLWRVENSYHFGVPGKNKK